MRTSWSQNVGAKRGVAAQAVSTGRRNGARTRREHAHRERRVETPEVPTDGAPAATVPAAARAAAPAESAPATTYTFKPRSVSALQETPEPSPSPVKNFQGVLPQTSIIPSGTVDYFRTSFIGESAIGKGFERETNQYRPTAVTWEAPSEEQVAEQPDRVTNLKERFSIVTSAKEFAKELSVGAGISVEAYGASLSGSMELNQNTEVSSNAVTVSLLRSYKSDPIMIADPVSNPSVQLRGTAREILEKQGPEKFHAKFGTHFVAGLTIGGLFNGFVQVITQSSDEAFSIKGEVQASIPLTVATVEGDASVSFSDTVKELNASTRTSYSALGWNKQFVDGSIKPPDVVTTYEEMIAAANEMEIDFGQRLEAILIAYEDLPDYQEALEEALSSRGETFDGDSFETLDKGKFTTIAQLLSQEFIALDFLRKVMENLLLNRPSDSSTENEVATAAFEAVEDLRQRAFLLQQNIQSRYSSDKNARANWFALDEYISFFRFSKLEFPEEPHDPNVPIAIPFLPIDDTGEEISLVVEYIRAFPEKEGKVDQIEKGRQLANSTFFSDEIEKEFDTLKNDPANKEVFFPTPTPDP